MRALHTYFQCVSCCCCFHFEALGWCAKAMVFATVISSISLCVTRCHACEMPSKEWYFCCHNYVRCAFAGDRIWNISFRSFDFLLLFSFEKASVLLLLLIHTFIYLSQSYTLLLLALLLLYTIFVFDIGQFEISICAH